MQENRSHVKYEWEHWLLKIPITRINLFLICVLLPFVLIDFTQLDHVSMNVMCVCVIQRRI